MFGLGRSVTLALVGWLWADILLGLFVIFLAAASPPVKLTATTPTIDPTPIELTDVPIDGSLLLGDDQTAIAAEQDRFVQKVKDLLAGRSETRHVALVFAYGKHEDPAQGSKLAERATAGLTVGQFQGAVLKTLHDIARGERGTKIDLEIYVYR